MCTADNGIYKKSTLINFLNPILKPLISCTATGAEDYPIDNLISNDRVKSQLGFIVYLSKPPVNLSINLICPIELNVIKIWPEIGSLKSTGFDVFMIRNDRQEKIATCENVDENGVMFCRINDAEMCVNNFKKCFFFRNLQNNMRVDKLMIRIWKTKDSCVPVIKKMEIWGKVSDKCALSENVNKLWKSRNISHDIPNESSDSLSLDSKRCTNDIEIPEEFLDAITHQIMAVPMILPSGKTVDQTTLDKFNRVEMTWGRELSDPFTGLTFTVNRKPIFDPALKSGIDRFLNKFPDCLEIRNVPRTVGTVVGSCKRGIDITSVGTVGGSCKRGIEITSPQKKLKTAASCSIGSLFSSDSTKYLSPTTKRTSDEIHCYNCRSGEELYRIMTCKRHFICRACLCCPDFHKNINQCSCGRKFCQNDVQKYHRTDLAFNYCLS